MTNQAMVGLNQLCCSIVIEKRTQKAENVKSEGPLKDTKR